MLDIIRNNGGCSVNELSSHFPVSRIAVMKNLRVLERAGLIVSEKKGRTRALYVNTVPIQMIHDRWSSEYSVLWAANMTRIKYRVESKGKKHGRNRTRGV